MMKKLALLFLFFSPLAWACDMLNAGYGDCLGLETKKSSPMVDYSPEHHINDNRINLNEAPIEFNFSGRIRSTVGTTTIKKKMKN